MKTLNKHLRTCSLKKGGCGRVHHTSIKYAILCEVCKARKRKEQEKIKAFKKTNETKFLKCGVCGGCYVARSMRVHIMKAHPKEYEQLMKGYYSLMENLEKIK